MDVLLVILSVLELLVSVGLIFVILMQSKNASGLTGSISGMGASQTYWDKNKDRSIEGKFAKYTKILAAFFFIIAFAISVILTVSK